MIDRQDRTEFPLGSLGRVLFVLWTLCILAGFGTAAQLKPDPRGFGTHEQLGLPPCTIQQLFGISCPSCGMTTSFSHFTRGQFLQSARANAAGLLIAMFFALQVPWCFISVMRGRLWMVRQPDKWLLWLLLGLAAATMVNWSVQFFLV